MSDVVFCVIVIIGMGVISVFGEGVEMLWIVLCEGCSGICLLCYECVVDLCVCVVVQVLESFDLVVYFFECQLFMFDCILQFVLVVVNEVIVQLGLDFVVDGLGLCIVVVVGIGVGGEIIQDEQSCWFYVENVLCLYLLSIVWLMINVLISQIFMVYGLCGLFFVVVSVCVFINYVIV